MSKHESGQEKKNNRLLYAVSIALVAALVFGSALGAFGAEFKDYKPPSRLDVQLYDWMRPNGSPSDGTKPDDAPTWQQDYPYRAFLFGGDPNSQGLQKHDSNMFVIFSKLPEIDLFTFVYRSGTKTRNQTGYIRARFDPKDPLLVKDDPRIPVNERTPDVRIVTAPGGVGVSPGPYSVPLFLTSNYRIDLKSSLDFDFYYQCCGTLEIKGLKSVMSVPYPYILTCEGSDGSGGGSQMPSNPPGGGSSGGGSSSEPDKPPESSKPDPPPPSSWDTPSKPGAPDWKPPDYFNGSRPWEEENLYQYPWEDDRNIPDFDISIPETPYVPGPNDEAGENGDTWDLPKWGDISLPFTSDDLYIPENPVPGIDQMNPNYPLFEGIDDWSWPPTVLPGDISDFPDKPYWMS